MARVLIVDDDLEQLGYTAAIANRAGFSAVTAGGGQQALELLRADPGIAAMVLDLVMPDLDGMAVLEAMRREGIGVPVIVQTTQPSPEVLATAMRHGAADYFVHPASPERLGTSLRNAMRLRDLETAVRAVQTRGAGALGLEHIVTRSPAMERPLSLVAKAGRNPLPVLIEGETGVGKELFARVIQGLGDRAGRPFVAVNCSTIPADRIEAELFGQRRGATPGATDLQGRFFEANSGTLFLDEVGDLPPAAQAMLLRAVQDGEIIPVGGDRPLRVNVRLITATGRRLLNLARAGQFREDLYYRLNVFPIYVPPLRDRPEDIAILTRHFLPRLAAEAGRRIHGLTDAATELLRRYNWPGNVRQLEGALYRAIVLSEGAWLDLADFPQLVALGRSREEAMRTTEGVILPSAPVHIDDLNVAKRAEEAGPAIRDRFVAASGEVTSLADVERELIVFALERYGYRMSRVARALGIGRSTLYRKLREFGLEDGVESDAA